MSREQDREALISLIRSTYHDDEGAVDRFLGRPHTLLGQWAPNQVIDSDPDGVRKVRELVERANTGIAI